MSRITGRVSQAVVFGAPPARQGPTVLQVNGTYLPVGESWIYDQATNVERYRIVVAARTLTNLGPFPFDPTYGISNASLPSRIFEGALQRLSGRSAFFARVARLEGASILHAHGGRTGAFITSTAEALGLPLVTSFYGADMWSDHRGHDAIRRRYAALASYGERFLVEGPAAAAQLVRIGFPRERILVHRLGVEVGNIAFRPRSLENGGELRVLMAARFMNKKGLPYGVEAFSRVAAGHPSMRMTIVGKRETYRDVRIVGELLAIARRHGVEGQVQVLGFLGRDELLEIASDHHLLLQPSVTTETGDAEGGHPVTLTMLAASGMPMLATRHCDIPEIVQEGRTGWLVGEKDVDALEAVLREVVHEPSKLGVRGANARKLVEEKYDVRQIRLDSVYDGIKSGK